MYNGADATMGWLMVGGQQYAARNRSFHLTCCQLVYRECLLFISAKISVDMETA